MKIENGKPVIYGDVGNEDDGTAPVYIFETEEAYDAAVADGLIPVDIDVTPMDNSKSAKEGVSRTYKGFDGYAPMMAYIGTEGYAINFELREGKQQLPEGDSRIPAGNNPPV